MLLGLSVFNKDYTLNIKATIDHAVNSINFGLHGVFFLVQLVKVS